MLDEQRRRRQGRGSGSPATPRTTPFRVGSPCTPTATNSSDPEPEADETADPWSSTWDDTSWQLPDSDSSESLYSSEELANYTGGTTSGSDWGDSYDHGGTATRGRGPLRRRAGVGGLGAVRRDGLRPRHRPLVRPPAQRRDRRPVDEEESPDGSLPVLTEPTVPTTRVTTPPPSARTRRGQRSIQTWPQRQPSGGWISPTAYGTPVAHAGSSGRAPTISLQSAPRGAAEDQGELGLRRAFGLGPGLKELLEQDRIDRIARPLSGRRNDRGHQHQGQGGKTLVTLMLASYLGRYRSGSVLAWDNNETEGTLGMRAPSQTTPHRHRPPRCAAADRGRPQRRHVRARALGA